MSFPEVSSTTFRRRPMGAPDIVGSWNAYLKNHILTGLHRPLINALAAFSTAVADAGHCASGAVAPRIAGSAQPASQRRRWERWLANPHFDVVTVQDCITQAIWS